MSSQPRAEIPGSKSRQRIPILRPDAPADDALEVNLGSPGPSTDDTPTIISRQVPVVAVPAPEGEITGIRGRRLAHFELIEPIGVGGMAAVLRARDTQLDRLVALKILPPEMTGDEEVVRRFHQEARSAAKLDHENIARVFFCGEDQRLHFIAFEFVEGDNLRTIIDRRGRLPVGEALHYMVQVAAGLSHAARRGVVHRDIKPSNIIITPNGRAKLVDMGLARCQETRSGGDLTQSGVTLGTFDYISPEQALEPREADVRSDIYSLGCTFYHVLTGRTPVPEGTAAKKLNCHQNVKPPDPREYVPDLPVEVVFILDRMMAKLPRDRFQSPEELVTQLLVVAGKLGISAEVPEGVLILDAPVPNPPVGRPVLWSALAVVAVVAVVLVLDQVPSGVPGTRGQPVIGPDVTDGGAQGKTGQGQTKPEVDQALGPTPDSGMKTALYEPPSEPNVRHLMEWLEQHRDADEIVLKLAGVLDLSGQEGGIAGLVVRARKKVTIRPYDPRNRPTLRFDYQLQPAGLLPLVALSINAPEAEIEGIRFEVDAHAAPELAMIALRLQGKKQTVRGCEFVQVQPSLREVQSSPGEPLKRLASLFVESSGKPRGELTIRDCAFLSFGNRREEKGGRVLFGAGTGGQDAVVRKGPVRLTAEGCVFGPHSTAFRLEGASGDEEAVTVKHCSVLLPARRSAVFEVMLGSSGKLDVSHSLFSRMAGDGDPEGAVLLRQADEHRLDAVTYQGRDNCYHDLDGYWCDGSDWQKAGWGDFRSKLANGRGEDDSRVLVFSPWKSDPAQQVEQLEKQTLSTAFAIRLDLGALRHGRDGSEVVGTESILGQRWFETLPTRTDNPSEQSVHRYLVVEKVKDEDSRYGIYPSLDLAVRIARPGDTILIRHNGDLAIDPVQLNKKGLGDLTIRPARRFRPVLVLGETPDNKPALFNVHDGKLRLEGLEFRLMPAKKLTMQTVVALVGNGECTLKDCVATLKRSSGDPRPPGDTRLALATLTETGSTMMVEMMSARPREQGPKLTLERCFIRGEGDLMWTRASRPFGLEMKDSLAALSGALVNIQTMPEAAAPAEAGTQISLSKVTTYLGGPLVRLATGKDPRGLVPITLEATSCLLLPSGTGKKMIALEGSDTDDKSLRDKWTWKGVQNAYGNFQQMQAQLPADDETMMMKLMGAKEWKEKEESSTFGVELLGPAETRFSQMEPSEFAPPEKAPDSGAKLTLLPRPYKPGADATKEK